MSELDRRTEIFERMPVGQALMRQIVPAVASQMVTLIYGMADTYFVGMLNEPHQTAAVAQVSSLFVMLTAISNLFGVGGASMIARYLGRKQEERAGQVSVVAFWGGLAAAVLFSAGFFLLAGPILRLLGVGEDTYTLAYEYARWTLVIGGPAAILNTLMANLIRAGGNAAAASIGVSMGGVINIILDPLFILPQFLGLGAVGAGMATAISNALAMIFFLIYLRAKRGTTVISLWPGHLRYAREHIGSVLSIGFPSAVQYALTMVAVAAQMKFVSGYELEAVAALGIVRKLDQIPIYFAVGVSSGMLPLLAYNHAAGNHRRRRDAFLLGCVISCGFSVLCLIVYEVFAPALIGLFIEDASTREFGAVFLRIMVTAMPLMALCNPLIVQFQAMGRAKESLICSVLRKGVIDIPLLFLMDRLLPLYGCMMVQPMVDAISLTCAIVFYRRINRTLIPENE